VKLTIFGLSISSAWGNGHATLWRGLAAALIRRGHFVCFFEKNVPYYASHRDLTELPGGELVLYEDFSAVARRVRRELADSEVAIVTSYCPDAIPAADLVLESGALPVFYDLDTSVTTDELRAGRSVAYIGPRGLQDYKLVLSYCGGPAAKELQRLLGARAVAPLYGSVDPAAHRAATPDARYRADLSYLGTYAPDRQQVLEELFLAPARARPELKFLLGGSLYPADFPWLPNLHYAGHVPPLEHPGFYSSARLNLSVTRGAMARSGYCPSGRLFEAAACGAPLISDWWPGIETFFQPGAEILIARETADVVAALAMSDGELRRIGQAARERTLAEHTAAHRAIQLEDLLDRALRRELPELEPA
jgi:spore maturation protein CgeB